MCIRDRLYTVGDEVRHIQSYVTIEQYKKAEIDFEIHVDEERCV